MKALIQTLLLILLSSLPSLANPGPKHGWHRPYNCLSDADAAAIVNKWATIRSADPTTAAYKALVDATVTDDVTLEDETISFFFFGDVEGPYSTNKTQLLSSFAFGASSSTSTPLVPVPAIPIRHDCDSITFRWSIKATINKVVPESYAKIGDPLHYKGTDILILCPGTHLIQHVVSSADYVRTTWQEGQNICYQRGSPMKPVCAAPVPAGQCFSPVCSA